MNENVYLRLRDFLDKLPGGFPATESGIELRILKKLFTPEQASIALQLSARPKPASALAPKLGMSEAQAAEKLESMARAGLLFRVRDGNKTFYTALQFFAGIYEFHLNTLDRELSEMLEEYFPYLAKVWESTTTKQFRIVPIGSSVSAAPTVSTYDRIRELIKGKDLISVAPCICQKEQLLLGNRCDRPAERCIMFDKSAQYYIDNNMGRRITEHELLEVLRIGEEKALVLSPTNAKKITSICLCCGCCCGLLRMIKEFPRPADHVQSPFQASIDPELCTACGTCLERCQIEAIQENEGCYEVSEARCIGCGLCVPACPAHAIALVEKSEVAPVPENFVEMQKRIAKERGML